MDMSWLKRYDFYDDTIILDEVVNAYNTPTKEMDYMKDTDGD